MRKTRRYLNPAFVDACRAFDAAREDHDWTGAVRASAWTLLFRVIRPLEHEPGRMAVPVGGRLHDRLRTIASLIGFDDDVLGEEVK